MEIKDEYVIVLSIILLLLTGYSLININKFMPANEKCNNSFKIINKCHCLPDEKLGKLFHINNTSFKINYTLGE